MRKGIRKWGIALGALAMSAVLVTAGCADGDVSSESPTPEPTVEQTETPTPEPTLVEETQTLEPSAEPSYVTFGTQTADGYSVVFTNGTGLEIQQIRVRNSDEKDYGENVIPAGTVVLPDEMFRLNIAREQVTDEATQSASADTVAMDGEEMGDTREIAFNETYDILLTFADGKEATLYDLGLSDITTAIIAYSAEADVAYISYVSAATNETVSTLDAQIARSRDEAAAALEEQGDTASASGGGSSSTGSSSSEANSSSDDSESDSSSSGGSSSSSGGNSNEDSSSSGGDSSGSDNDYVSSDEGSDSGSEPDQSLGECIEDNIIWND